MKPRNFPARKLLRQLKANKMIIDANAISLARSIKTKKVRSSKRV